MPASSRSATATGAGRAATTGGTAIARVTAPATARATVTGIALATAGDGGPGCGRTAPCRNGLKGPRIGGNGRGYASPGHFDPNPSDLPNQPPAYQGRDLLGEDAALQGAASALLDPDELGALSLFART